jgi:hypothetical protein
MVAALELGCRLTGLGKKQEIARYIADWTLQWQDDFYVLSPEKGANRDGMRDGSHTIENPTGRPRAVFLGDSVTFGYRLPPAESYPAMVGSLVTNRLAAAAALIV